MKEEDIEHFRKYGYVVVSVFSPEEVAIARQGLANTLKRHHVCVEDLEHTAANLKALSSTNGAGGILDLFYEDWKFRLNEDERVVSLMRGLWAATYASNAVQHFEHPFGAFDANKGFMYVDRLCYRVPDGISEAIKTSKKTLQRSLTPHLDCCPTDRFSGKKWRPIQCFVALTDTLEPNWGGFEICPEHHINFDAWVANRPYTQNKDGTTSPPPCVGQFTPIRPKEDQDIIERFQHIPMKAGDVVFWDYRIPHANAQHNYAPHAREVAYLGFLPHIPINETYALDQLDRFRRGVYPADQWHKSTMTDKVDYEFSDIGRKLMAIEPW